MKTTLENLKAQFYKLKFKHQASIALGTIGSLFISAPLTGMAIAFAYKKEIVESVEENKEKLALYMVTEAVKTKTLGALSLLNIFKRK